MLASDKSYLVINMLSELHQNLEHVYAEQNHESDCYGLCHTWAFDSYIEHDPACIRMLSHFGFSHNH